MSSGPVGRRPQVAGVRRARNIATTRPVEDVGGAGHAPGLNHFCRFERPLADRRYDGTAPLFSVTRCAFDGGYVCYQVESRRGAEPATRYTFTGSVFGGLVVMSWTDDDGSRHARVIHHSRRFGEFASESWVHRFVAEWRDAQDHIVDVRDATPGSLTTRCRVTRR
jgi:hypothetical protein